MSETDVIVHVEFTTADGAFVSLRANSADDAIAELETLRGALGTFGPGVNVDVGEGSLVTPEPSGPEKVKTEDPAVKPLEQAQAEEAERKRVEKEKRAAKAAEKKKAAEEAAAAAGDDFDEEADASDEQPVPSVEDVRKAVVPLGRVKGLELLGQYGASKISEVPEAKRAELIAKARGAK